MDKELDKKGETMNIFQKLQQGFQSFWQGIVRNFSPGDDDYPQSGVQPYEGETSKKR